MKTTTFNFLALSAKEFLDFEAIHLDPERTPLEHFVHTRTKPSKRQIEALVEAYDKNRLRVILPGRGIEAFSIRDAIKELGDSAEPDALRRKTRGRPVISERRDLMPLKDLVFKYAFTLRDLASLAGMNPSGLSVYMNRPTAITDQKLEQVLSGAQMLFAGHPKALRELRALERQL